MGEIVLPGSMRLDGASGAQLAAASAEIEKREEAKQLDAEIQGRLHFLPPYRDDAPVCDAIVAQGTEPTPTRHHGVIQFPAWSHGRRIGPECVRFLRGLNVCGRVVQDLAAAVALGIVRPDVARTYVEKAALPPLDEQSADE